MSRERHQAILSEVDDVGSDPILDAFDIKARKLAPIIDDNALQSDGFPYEKKLKQKAYDKELLALQIELVKLQTHVREVGQRVVVLFEGRDTAGKGSCIKRVMEYLNPRHARSVALAKPTETESGQWYFQRYVEHLPSRGEIVLFDRSWYNRSGVERVMGFCTKEELADFLREAPQFEGQLVRDGIKLFKIFLTIGREMQLKRFHARQHDPLKQWKLSPVDLAAIPKWDAYTAAKHDTFRFTHTETAPWTVVRANDKRRARLNVIRHILSKLDYKGKNETVATAPDAKIVGSGADFFYDDEDSDV